MRMSTRVLFLTGRQNERIGRQCVSVLGLMSPSVSSKKDLQTPQVAGGIGSVKAESIIR